MLKKRILASSMASVMALGSVSVAAFADETKDYGEAVTAKELQEYVDGLEDFIADELPNYGSKQGERFQAAYDHALAVLEDDDSEAADYTAAYQMVKAVKEKLTIYTASELGKLISDNQKKYDQNNEFNEDLQDNIYTESTYADFSSAFDDATRYVESGDSMMITDAYIGLEDAVAKLSELATVTKSQFRTALRAYEELEYEMKDYESWRRGVLTVAPTTGTSKNKGDLVKKAPNVDFADLWDLVYGKGAPHDFKFWDGEIWDDVVREEISADDKDEHTNTEGTWIGGYDVDLGTEEDALRQYIKKCYKEFDDVKNATITSKPEIVAAYDAAVDAVAIFNGWKPDGYKSGSKSSCANLIKKYRPQLVETFNADDIEALIEAINFADGGVSGWYEDKDSDSSYNEDKDGKKYTLKHDAEDHTLKCNMALYIIKDKDTGLWVVPTSASDVEDCVWKTSAEAEAKLKDETGKDGMTVQKISAGTNILTYMHFTAELSTEIDAEISSAQSTYQGKVTDASAIIDTEAAQFTTPWQCQKDEEVFTADAAITGESKSITYYHISSTGDGMGSSSDKTTAEINASNAAVDQLKKDYEALETRVTALKNLKEMGGDFEAANGLYEQYLGFDFPDDADDALAAIEDFANGKTISKASGSTTEWTIVWRKLAYALEDLFPVVVKDNLTLSDLKKMIDRAYDIAEQTGDSSLFAKKHMLVVDEREKALDFYKKAKAETGWKTDEALEDGRTLATVYDDLKSDVETLEKWLKGFAYSYGEIKADIAKIADAIEKGEVKGDDLKAKLAQCAYDLSVLQPSDIADEGDADDNVAFDDERVFQAANRLKTDKQKSKAKPNDYEKNLKKSYEALVKAYDEALTGTAPSGVEGDVDNDGAVTFADVNAVLAAFLKGDTDAKFDVNGDKAVDFDDVNKALDIFLKAQA